MRGRLFEWGRLFKNIRYVYYNILQHCKKSCNSAFGGQLILINKYGIWKYLKGKNNNNDFENAKHSENPNIFTYPENKSMGQYLLLLLQVPSWIWKKKVISLVSSSIWTIFKYLHVMVNDFNAWLDTYMDIQNDYIRFLNYF